jgi:hypothetical protein
MNSFKPLFLVALFGLALPTWAEDVQPTNADGTGELSLPWTAFEKLLRLDQDNVILTWDEFQRLVKQTGVQEMPPFQLQDGKVSLSRTEFKNLLNRMKLPAGEVSKTFLTKALYTGRVTRKGAVLTATLSLQILSEGPVFTPARIPLFPGNVAFEEILLDGKPALIENANGWTTVTSPTPGAHVVTAIFSLPASLDKEPYRLSFNVPETPITQMDLLLAAPNLDARVDGASHVQSIPGDGGTRVKASLPQTKSITLSWNAVEPESAKGPAKVYATIHQRVSVQDDAVHVTAQVELDVLQNTINNLSILLPEGYTRLDVTGEAVGDWKLRGEGDRTLFIPFAYARKGRFNVLVKAEHPLKEKEDAVAFSGFQVLGAVRESGDLLVEKATNGEVTVSEKVGLSRLDAREIPDALKSLSTETFLEAHKYIRPPIRLGLDIQRHEEIAVVSSLVDSANAVTLVQKDGKCVTHLTLTVRNTARQFVELNLPTGAEVWSVFVEGRPVRASKTETGATLIPLNRSRIEGQTLAPFEVEVMYYRNLGRPSLAGKQNLEVPHLDLKVSQLLWSVYLPTDRNILYFGGSVDKEKEAEGIQPLISVARGKLRILKQLSVAATDELFQSSSSGSSAARGARIDKARQSAQYSMKSDFDESQGINETAYAQQVEREINFFSNVNRPQNAAGTGDAAPLRIKVPNAGQVYRFSKVLLQENEPVTLVVHHAHSGLVKTLKGLGILVILLIFFRVIPRTLRSLRDIANRYPKELSWLKTPAGMTVGLFVGAVALTFISRFLAVVAFLGGCASAIRWAWNTLARKRNPS